MHILYGMLLTSTVRIIRNLLSISFATVHAQSDSVFGTLAKKREHSLSAAEKGKM